MSTLPPPHLITDPARPWYGLDDSRFVKGTEGSFVTARKQRLITKAWLPPAAADLESPPPAGAAVPGVAPAVSVAAPFPKAILLFVHGFVRVPD